MGLNISVRPIRVANVIEEGRWGGPQRRISLVAAALRGQGVETVVILPKQDSDRFMSSLDALGIARRGVEVSRAGRHWRSAARYLIRFAGDVRSYYRELSVGEYDLVHLSGGVWQVRGALAAWILRIPIIWHLNDTKTDIGIRIAFRFVFAPMASGFLLTARRTFRYYLEGTSLAKKPWFFAQAPVDTAAFDPAIVEPDREILSFPGFRIVMVGHVNPIKGIQILIDAAALLADRLVECSLIIVGPVFESQRQYLSDLKEHARTKRIDHRVHFLGERENVAAVLRAASVVVCSSVAEAGPMALWEAMALECAVVSTDVGDVSMYVRSRENGYVVPVGDAVAMSNAIARLACDQELCTVFGRRAREVVCRELDVKRVAEQTLGAYRSVVDSYSHLRRSRTVAPSRILGIDAASMRSGGGLTYIRELLRAVSPDEHGFSQVVVWGSRNTLTRIEDRTWLLKCHQPLLDRGLFCRMYWQKWFLPRLARNSECSVLLVPGGTYSGNFFPIVAMSHNFLPFDWPELRRYGWTFVGGRLLLLRFLQSQTFRRADGVIFLNQFARDRVKKLLRRTAGLDRIVSHGVDERFFHPPRKQLAISSYSFKRPFRILYVSIIDWYKHQWNVAEAVAQLRESNWPVVLDLVGPSYLPAMERLTRILGRIDPAQEFLRYRGPMAYDKLHEKYVEADLFVFASTCENQPIILLEAMASGLPIVCSNRGVMPSVLGDAGLYCDPESPRDLARTMREMIESPNLRASKAKLAGERALAYSWKTCARETFEFAAEVARACENKYVSAGNC